MTEQKERKTKKTSKKWIIITLLICGIFLISTLTFLKATDKPEAKSTDIENRGSYLIAEQGLEKFRLSLNAITMSVYKETMERYERLSPTDRAAFDVEKIVTVRVQQHLLQQVGQQVVIDNYEIVKGIQPTSNTIVLATPNAQEFIVQTTGAIGGDETKLQQTLRIDLEIPKTVIKDKYSLQYAIHAQNKIVVQNASNILGVLANSNPKKTTIDGSSCQHEFSGDAYLKKCLNDGNTSASHLKIMNGQSFKSFLPSFPTKEITALEESDYNNEELYFEKKIPKDALEPDMDVLEETNDDISDENTDSDKKDEEKTVTIKIHYLKDGILTIDEEKLKVFKEDAPFNFTSSEEHLNRLDIDGVEAFINIGDGVQTLRIDELNMTGNAKLHFVGNGDVKLFIKDFTSSEGQILTNGAKISTYYDGTAPLNLSNNFTSAGFIYVKNADLSLMMDTYQENIISGGSRVVINGGASPSAQLLLAPKASIELANRTHFKGAIIGQSVIVSDSAVTYAKPDKSMSFPIEYPQYGDVRQTIIYSKPEKY